MAAPSTTIPEPMFSGPTGRDLRVWAQVRAPTPHHHGEEALVGLGMLALLTGAAVYALWRPWPTPTSATVGLLVGSAPSLMHAFAFTLWTALVLRGQTWMVCMVVLAWATLESLIEAFQHPVLHALLPTAVSTRWAGTFDLWDLLASLLGSVLAGMLAWRHAVLKEPSR